MLLLLSLMAHAGDFGQVRLVLTWDSSFDSAGDWLPILQDSARGKLGETTITVKCGAPAGKKTCAIVAEGAELARSTDVTTRSGVTTVNFPGGATAGRVTYESITMELRPPSPAR